MNKQTAIRLDWKKLLGFNLVPSQQGNETQKANLNKIGVKLGGKPGKKPPVSS